MPGKHLSSHMQHDTIRKLKSAYGNWLRSSSKANQAHYVMCDDGGKVIIITNDLSSLLWYHCFNTGMKYQMGTIWKPNKALSTELIVKLLEGADKIRRRKSLDKVAHKWMVFGVYIMIFYVISLQGSEGFFLDLKALQEKNINT